MLDLIRALLPGDVRSIAERDYLYGLDRIEVRVIQVIEVQSARDGMWLYTHVMQLHDDGSDWRERNVAIRLSSLAAKDES